jgi:hypothetical protein
VTLCDALCVPLWLNLYQSFISAKKLLGLHFESKEYLKEIPPELK